MKRYFYPTALAAVSILIILIFPGASNAADVLNVNRARNNLYNKYTNTKMKIFEEHGALNPDGSVNKNAPRYNAAVEEIQPHHDRMMKHAGELGAKREEINQRIYKQARAANPQSSGTDPLQSGGRGGFGDAEGTAKSTGDYERIAKSFKKNGYHVDRQPDYIKIEELDTVIHRPAGPADAVGGSAHDARVAAQARGGETGGSAYGQSKYQGQGGDFAKNDKLGAGLDSIKKIQDAVNAEPKTPWERYQRDQVIAKETNRLRESAGMGEDPHLAKIKQGMDPDLMSEIKGPVKDTALDQARSAWPKIEEKNKQNLAELDKAIKAAGTPEEAADLAAERNNILNRQQSTKNAVVAKDGGKAFKEVTGKDPIPKPGFFDNHPIERNLKPYFDAEPGKVTELLEKHGGKVMLILTAAQTISCLNQGKTIGQCAMELVEGSVIGSAAVVVLGPTGATILGGVAGAYQIYEGGVEATKQWSDRKQRNAAYLNRDVTTRINLEDLDKYIKDFREKRIYGELQESARSVSSTCGAVDAQVKSAGDQLDGTKYKRLFEVTSAIKKASAECSNAKPWPSEIANLQSQTKTFEDKIIQGLDGAQATAAKCESLDDAAKIKKLYDNCTGLAAKVKGYSMVAAEKNAKLNDAIKKRNDADAAFVTAQALAADLAQESVKASAIKNALVPQILAAIEKKKAHSKRANEMLSEIDRLRLGFPDKLYGPDEKKFGELKGLVAKYKELTCDPEAMYWIKWLDTYIVKGAEAVEARSRKWLDEANNSIAACKGLASADKDTDAINASANWVLTAIGMNEDLPKKADQCIAKIKSKRDAQVAATKCWPGSNAYWDDKKNAVGCRCANGFKWNKEHNACIIDKQAPVAAADCSNHPNSRPYWDEKQNQVRCAWCNPGFKFRDSKGIECVDEKAELIAKADCSNHPGSRPYWDDKEKQVRCTWCNPGYVWRSANSTECVPDRATQVANADCSGTPNSRPYWDDGYNEVRCAYCNPGYHFRSSNGTDCVADDPGPNFNDLNLTNAIQQINNANQNYRNEMNNINNQWNQGRQNLNRQKEHNAFCDNYARTAVQKFQESVSRGCGYSDRRWQDSYENHYGWCVTVSKESANSETRARETGLSNCAENAERKRKERQNEIQGLRDKIAGWENGLKCLEEGKRKFPKMELNCNGNFLLGSRDGEIRKLQNLISEGKNRLRVLSSNAY